MSIMVVDGMLAHNTDVSKKESYWGDYRLGQQYELRMDVFIEHVDNWSQRLVLTPEGQLPQCAGLYSAPGTFAEYYANPDLWPNVVGVVAAGTTIECKMVRKHGTILWGSSVTVFAEILDGPYQGAMVDIEDLSGFSSTRYRDIILSKPDSRILRAVVRTGE